MKQIIRAFGVFIFLLLVIALVWWFFFRPVPQAAIIKPAPAQSRRAEPSLGKHFIDQAWSKKLEAKARLSAAAWAACFGNTPPAGGRATLAMSWSGSSHLIGLKVRPAVAPEVEQCLMEQVRGWNLPVAPSLRPFRFEQEVLVSGR